MSQEFFWMVLTIVMTALFWVPYVLDRIFVRGLFGALGNPSADDKPQSAWAQRAMRAHQNGIENLAIFAPLVLAVQAAGVGSALTAGAAALYFFARLAYFLVYTMGIPVIRTLAFAAGWVAQMVLALTLLGQL